MNLKISFRNTLVFSASLIITALSASAIFAQVISPSQTPRRGINVTLSPVFMNLGVQAGSTKKSSFKITNNNDFSEIYRISVIKYQPDSKGSIIPAEPPRGGVPDTSLGWFKFPLDRVTVLPRSTQKVDFELSPPKDAFLGYYFGIAIERSREDFAQTDTTKVVGAPTIPILLEVTRQGDTGTIDLGADTSQYKSGVLQEFKTSSSWYEYLPVEFEVTFKNTGKIHLVPFGEIFVGQGKNSEIGTLAINEDLGNTLPNSQRTYKSAWTDGFVVREPVKENGTYKKDDKGNTINKTKIYWDKLTKFRIGKYTAHAVLVYNNGQFDVPIELSTSFWIIPWKIIIVLAILVALILFGLRNLFVGIFRP